MSIWNRLVELYRLIVVFEGQMLRFCQCAQLNRPLQSALGRNVMSQINDSFGTGTFAEAIDFCRNIPGENRRLCTPDELKNSCAKDTGCNFDEELVWSCSYDGHGCSTDAECCGHAV